MVEKLNNIRKEVKKEIFSCESLKMLEDISVEYLGRKGKITRILRNIGSLPKERRPQVGKGANKLKNEVSKWIEEKAEQLKSKKLKQKREKYHLDVTLPGQKPPTGHKHPVTKTTEEICNIFSEIGFEVVLGPEIETEYHNFEALNIPLEHPSRDVFDTFYLDALEKEREIKQENDRSWLLRSQTSTVQIRAMEDRSPPLKIVAPGKVYRPDTVDASHSFMFNQLEGLMVDENLVFSHLKGTLLYFAKRLFTQEAKVRFRPHFFPFTEPSAEVDVSCIICQGKGCTVCSYKGWLEILGAGMVDPNVFEAVGYDYDKYSGFAFGVGIERIAMLKYGINDIRLFTNNDKRFLTQF